MPDAAGPLPNLPDPAVVVLVGPSGAGKSTWAANRYRQPEIVSSDALRAVVGTGPHDLDASVDAFAVLDSVLAARARRGLAVVVDSLGLESSRRRGYLELARRAGLPAVVVVFETPAAVCRARNRAREVPVPAGALDQQLRTARQVSAAIDGEGWDVVVRVGGTARPPESTTGQVAPTPAPMSPPPRTELYLQVSRFPWGDDPVAWLSSIARAAEDAGFTGLALMDHLIQIPQVGRAWEPIPEPWVTLGLLAGRTGRLRLGTLVSPVTWRDPGVLAKSVATLDVLSGGRAFCGLGAGWWAREHAAFGVPFPSAEHRLDLLEAAIETLRALWSPGTKSFAGDRVTLPETTCYPRPVGPVPILVGGSGRRTLAIAARLADGCNVRAADLDAALPLIERGLAEAERDRAEFAVTVLDTPVLGTDREHTATLVERLRGRTPADRFVAAHPVGTVDAHVGRYRRYAEKGVSAVFLALPDLAGPDEVLRWGPVVAALTAG